MENKYILGIVALAMIALLGVGVVSAYSGFGSVGLSDEDNALMQEQRDAMRTAVENGDYAVWE